MSIDGMAPMSSAGWDNDVQPGFVEEPGEGVLEAARVIDRGASARANLRGMWSGDADLFGGLKGILLPDKLIGTIKRGGGGVDYLAALVWDFIADPLLGTFGVITDGVQAATHGILAGFQDDSKLTDATDHQRDVVAQLGPLTSKIAALPESVAGSGPVGSEDQAIVRVAEQLTGTTPRDAGDHPFQMDVSSLVGGYRVNVSMTSADGSRLDLGAYDVNEATGEMSRSKPPRFPEEFLLQAAADIQAELLNRLGQPGAPDLSDGYGFLVTPDGGLMDRILPVDDKGRSFDTGITVVLGGYVHNPSGPRVESRLDPFIRDVIRTTPSLQTYACLDINYSNTE
jgi:hypothetical protein